MAMQGSLWLLWLLIWNSPSSLSIQCSVYALSLLQLISLIWAVKLTCWWGWRGAEWSPLGTIDGSPSHTHTLLNGGPDRQLACTLWHLQMLPLCMHVCVYTLYTSLGVCTHNLSVCVWRAHLPLPLPTSLCSTSKEGFASAVFLNCFC